MTVLRSQGSTRARALLVVGCLVALIGTYWAIWGSYVKTHTVTRYVQAAPGAPGTIQGATLQVQSMVITDTLRSDGVDGEPQVSPAGGTYVVVRLQVTTEKAEQYPFCSPALVGADGRTWESELLTVYRTKIPSSCDESKPGVPQVVEKIYAINVADAPTLYGLALDDKGSADPVTLIRPPA